ncbi:unnamed protein product [Phytophthora fragariaefolia]|uniref:Unnamed protein product n=1 Tax=Phytophthora fragariaefolia TaxID=1490495 RepID=A0A9W6Y916_9STRA|nr:unnamed protein product [Phytophthora fragariaefolia]
MTKRASITPSYAGISSLVLTPATPSGGVNKSKVKASRIAPGEPTSRQLKIETKRFLGCRQLGALSFRQAFGVLGIPMLFILLVCVTWTSWLVFLALAPNKAANLLMGTSSYDHGEFLLITDPNPYMTMAGAVGLAVVDICYLTVTLRMLFWRDILFSSAFHSHPNTLTSSRRGIEQWLAAFFPKYNLVRSFWRDFTAFEGKNRKDWVSIVAHQLFLVLQSHNIYIILVECIPEANRYRHGVRNVTTTIAKCMNLTFCYRFERVLETLLWTRHRDRIVRRIRTGATPVSQQPVPKGVTIIFVAVSLIVLLSTHKAVSDSKKLCSVYPECVVFVHRWESTDQNCPCLIAIDIDIAPKTYNEWINPADAYGKVKSLAAAGMLSSLQVINRQLLELPEELRKCSGLKVM